MAYYRYGRRSGGGKKIFRRKRSKYTQAEQVAFSLGQKQRVIESIKSNNSSRVKEAYAKGYAATPANGRKPLF